MFARITNIYLRKPCCRSHESLLNPLLNRAPNDNSTDADDGKQMATICNLENQRKPRHSSRQAEPQNSMTPLGLLRSQSSPATAQDNFTAPS